MVEVTWPLIPYLHQSRDLIQPGSHSDYQLSKENSNLCEAKELHFGDVIEKDMKQSYRYVFKGWCNHSTIMFDKERSTHKNINSVNLQSEFPEPVNKGRQKHAFLPALLQTLVEGVERF